jgi:predicted RecA/RadA family phage recombinase
MATNTLIQKLFGSDESGVGEDSSAVSNRRSIEKFRASEAIAAGACVSLDVSQASNGLKAMVIAEADGTDYIPVGVAENAIASGEYGDVVLRGIVEEALTKGDVVNIAAGDRLTYSTAGKLVKVDSFRTDLGDGTGTTTGTVAQAPLVVAVALEATTADGSSRVMVLRNF